ncbi:hypothetical protein [Amnibacterium kyonggiense]|uniref:Shikimate kinase n=1 Tax=Amnibacterium kyonggiense TaxID=595671 RepID=A0A4V3EAK8_9MICO|nr:hypothetical protein [Amnibacterium kyonggiense]TDS77034.1 shikimate kinase [Amnibacterium kyonggiense]
MAAARATVWIGGGSGAGKSTVARILGERHGRPVVHTDESLHEHATASAGDPAVDAFVRMSMDERWVDRRPGEMLATFPWFAGAAFDLLLRDLPRGPLVVEGFRLLPGFVRRFVELGDRAVWLLPTPEQRARAFAGRAAEGRAFWERTRDPARALANVLERDRLFTEVLRDQCAVLGLPVVDVDGSEGAEAVADRVEGLLGPLG